MAKTQIAKAQPKNRAAKVVTAAGKGGKNPTNPTKAAGKVVQSAKGGKGLSQNSVAAKLTSNSGRGSVKKNLKPMVTKTPSKGPLAQPRNSKASSIGGKFKRFISGK